MKRNSTLKRQLDAAEHASMGVSGKARGQGSSHADGPRIALALAGGGPMGAIYEIGALCALEQSLVGIDFNRLQHYIGVSAGGFIAAGLANGMTPQGLCAAFIENDSSSPDAFDPAWLMVPAYGEFARRGVMWPGLMARTLWGLTLGGKSLTQVLERLGAGLPTGVFSNQKVDLQLARMFSQNGYTNDFRQLKTQLTLVATNLNTGDAAPFGRPGWDHIPISQAVQASSALPGLFPPVEIDDQYYVDGALKKTLHASVALDDPKSHLCAPAKAPTRIGRAIASLQEVIDDLGHLASRPIRTG